MLTFYFWCIQSIPLYYFFIFVKEWLNLQTQGTENTEELEWVFTIRKCPLHMYFFFIIIIINVMMIAELCRMHCLCCPSTKMVEISWETSTSWPFTESSSTVTVMIGTLYILRTPERLRVTDDEHFFHYNIFHSHPITLLVSLNTNDLIVFWYWCFRLFQPLTFSLRNLCSGKDGQGLLWISTFSCFILLCYGQWATFYAKLRHCLVL